MNILEEPLRQLAANVRARKAWIGTLGIGLAVSRLVAHGFDYLLYPFVIWKLGPLKGGVVMTLTSLLLAYLLVIFYDRFKTDWLGIETLKGLREHEQASRFVRFWSWVLKKGEPAVFFFLSLKFDPFTTVVYMRRGAHQYNGLNKRDWVVFLSSGLLANCYWTLVTFAGVSLLEWLWRFISGM